MTKLPKASSKTDVADFLNNRKRKEITRIEDEANVVVRIAARTDVGPEHMIIKAVDGSGGETKISVLADSKS